jgi:hypothetical protein
VDEATLTVFAMTAPIGVPTWTPTTSVKPETVTPARLALLAVTVPLPPAAGVVTVQPAGAANETKVVPVGRTSVRVTCEAASGPALVMATA